MATFEDYVEQIREDIRALNPATRKGRPLDWVDRYLAALTEVEWSLTLEEFRDRIHALRELLPDGQEILVQASTGVLSAWFHYLVALPGKRYLDLPRFGELIGPVDWAAVFQEVEEDFTPPFGMFDRTEKSDAAQAALSLLLLGG